MALGSESFDLDVHRRGAAAVTYRAVAAALSAHQGRVLLVVDDLHRFGADALEGLAGILETAPNALAIAATRRLDARGLAAARLSVPVRVVDAAQLAMTRLEVAELVMLRLPDRDLSSQLADRLYEATEGHPGLLHTTIAALEAPEVGGQGADMTFAFRAQVDRTLARADELARRILLASSVIDVFTTDIVAAMLGEDPGHVGECFDAVEDLQVVSIPGATAESWLCFHRLTRDELRHRALIELGPEEVRRLQRVGGRHLAAARPREAMAAAIDAKDWALLTAIMKRTPPPMTSRDRAVPLGLSELSEEARRTNPLVEAYALIEEFARPRGRFGSVLNGLKKFSEAGTDAVPSHDDFTAISIVFLRMVAARLAGNQRQAERLSARVGLHAAHLEAEEAGRSSRIFAVGIAQLALTRIFIGDLDGADDALELVPLDAALGSGTPHLAALQAMVAALRGDMPELRNKLDVCEEFAVPGGWQNEYVGAGYRIGRAVLALEEGDPEAAEREVDALRAHERTIEHWPFIVGIRSDIEAQRHGPAAALTVLDRETIRRRGRFRLLPDLRDGLIVRRARLLWLQGRQQTKRTRRNSGMAEAFALMAQGDLNTAGRVISRYAADAAAAGRPCRRADALLLSASISLELGDLSAATRDAHEAVVVLDRYELTSPLRRLPRSALTDLATLAPTLRTDLGTTDPAHEVRPLTPAELRAFTAVARTGNVPAAAAQLYLSAQTVRSHLKRVYRKLGVHSLADAVRVAGRSGLLEEDVNPLEMELD